MSPGVSNDSLIDDVCRAYSHFVSVVLQGMHFEFDTRYTIMRKWSDLEGVQGRGSCASVNFDLDSIYANVRQADPLTPSDGQQILILAGQ